MLSKIGGTKITTIGEDAFKGKGIKEVIIPSGITTFEQGTFEANELTSLVLPNGVKKLGTFSFQSNKIKSIVIPDPIDEVGYAAFYNNSLENVTIGKNVISLEIDSFGSSGPDHNYLRRVVIKGKSSSSEFSTYDPDWAWASDVTCVKDNTENVENGCIIWEGSN